MKKLSTLCVAVFFLFAPAIVRAQTDTQQIWLHALATCESKNRTHIKVLDSNHKYSYGELQFQMSTFLGYAKYYHIVAYGVDIYTPAIQEEIASQMLSDGLYYHWKTCSARVIKNLGYFPA